MSTITTRSVFYYGTSVTLSNRAIDFREGAGPEINATLKVGSYSLTEYVIEVQRAMNEVGGQAYTVNLNRTTRAITISAPGNFTLKSNTGSRAGTAAWEVLGFSILADQTGTNTYTSTGTGKEYQTQYPINNYTGPNHSILFENAAYNVTPVGIGQVVSFGDGLRIELNIRVITDITGIQNQPFYNNANGVANFMDFIRGCMTRDKVEFMPDVDARGSFTKLLLESTQDDRNGLEFNLRNMDTANFYESGRLTFRKILT